MQEFFVYIRLFSQFIRREVNMEITGDVENSTDKLAVNVIK